MYKIKPNKKLGHRSAAGNVQQILQLPQHFQSTWPRNLWIELFSIPPCVPVTPPCITKRGSTGAPFEVSKGAGFVNEIIRAD